MYSMRSDESKGCRVRQGRGLRCALAAMFVAMGGAHACAQCTEEQKLTASDAGAFDVFGNSVCVSGDTILVGADFADHAAGIDSGAAYVFRFNGVSWLEEEKLTASDATAGDAFGVSVSLSGDIAVVGTPRDDRAGGVDGGAAYVFRYDGTSWVQEQKLTVSDVAAGDNLGRSVSVSGDTAVVGASLADCAAGVDCGAAYVFRFNGTFWVEEQKLTASDAAAHEWFGRSVSVSGDSAVVGADLDDCAAGIHCGSAYVFRFNGTTWIEEQKLVAPVAGANDRFGASVSLSGDTAVVGEPRDRFGAAYVFRFNGTSWVVEQKLRASDRREFDQFGASVSVSGETILVGSFLADCTANVTNNCGAAYLFRFNGISWVQEQKLTDSNAAAAGDKLGASVSVNGNTAVVGASGDDCASQNYCGSAFVFRCVVPCGNGILDPGEQCDLGLGCTECLCDAGFEPTTPRSVDCQPICGNGSLNPGEACDGVDDSACPGACQSDCTCGPFCGDGTCGPGEGSCNCPIDCGAPPASEAPGSTCRDGLDNDCDGFADSADPDCADEPIPTVSQWGMIFTALLLLAIGRIVFPRTARCTGALGAMPKP